MQKRLCLILLLIPWLNSMNAQVAASDLKNFTVFTPNAYSFSAVDNIPANQFTGAIKPSLDLFNKKMSEISFKMSFDFLGGGGLKLDDPGSIIGKGWFLNMGGMIVRNVRDLPDDYENVTPRYYDPIEDVLGEYSGVLYNVGVPKIPDSEGDHFVGLYMESIYRNHHADMQHDIFQFTFAGRSGKFYIGKNREILVVDGSKLQIIPTFGNSVHEGNTIGSFTIIDEAGIKYIFDQVETGQNDHAHRDFTTSGSIFQRLYVTGWLLSRIESPYNEESVTFEYERRVLANYVEGTKYYKWSRSTASADPYGMNTVKFYGGMSDQYAIPLDIKSVTFSDGTKIKVNYFGHVPTTADPNPVVQNIEIFGPQDELIKRFHMNYLVYDRDGAFTYFNYNLGQYAPMPGKQHMHLESVVVGSPDNKLLPLYTFSYYLDATHNEARSFYNQSADVWGFHNGQANPENLLLSPFSVHAPPANRSVSLEHTLTGALKSITYPTGGSEEFVYELHDKLLRPVFGSERNEIVGGLRLKKRILHDGVNSQNDIVKEYKYIRADGMSSGFLGDRLQFTYLMHTYDSGWPTNPHIKYTDTVDVSHPVNPLSSIDGSFVAYNRVEEITMHGNTTNGKIVYEFSDLSYTANWAQPDFFPYNPVERPTWAIGLPTTITYLNAAGDTVKKIVNEYNITQSYKQTENFRSLHFALKALNVGGDRYHIYKYKNHYPLTGRADLKKTHQYEYTAEGTMYTLTELERHPVYHSVVKAKIIDSRGRMTESISRYPFDYTPGAIYFVGGLMSKNILSIPIARETWKDDGGTMKLLDASVTEFASVNGMLRPSKEHRTANSAPLAVSNVFNPSVLLNPAYQFRLSATYNNYDAQGRLLTSTLEPGGQKSSVISDASNNVIAKATNAGFDEIAYTSFENGSGNWTFSAGMATTTTHKTGDKSYNGTLSKTSLPAGDYIVRFWAKGNAAISVNSVTQAVTGDWSFYTIRLNNINNVTINTNGSFIDELAVSPVSSLLQTYTYNEDQQVTSVCENSGQLRNYEFDTFGRLVVTRDKEDKIAQAINYEPHMFGNQVKSLTLTDYCFVDQVPGGPVTYEVPANRYVSSISQADADMKAQWDINFNALEHARATGGCKQIYWNTYHSSWVYMQGCGVDEVGPRVIYEVPAKTHSSLISLEDAEAKARADIAMNTPTNAIEYGVCMKKFNIKVANFAGAEGYTVTFWDTFNWLSYEFPINTYNGVIGQIPAGVYDIIISNPNGSTTPYTFTAGCTGAFFAYDTFASFYGVDINEICSYHISIEN